MKGLEERPKPANFIAITPEGESSLLGDPKMAEELLAEAEQTLIPGKIVASNHPGRFWQWVIVGMK